MRIKQCTMKEELLESRMGEDFVVLNGVKKIGALVKVGEGCE